MIKKNENADILIWLIENFNTSQTMIDIGAKKGKWFRSIKKHFPKNQSYVFEPIPNNYDKLKKTLAGTNCNLYKVALSDKEGTMSFFVDLDAIAWSGLKKQKNNGNYKEIIVEVKKLDSFNFDNVGFIKIDVEGNELFTLNGAIQTIQKNRPIIYFECADVHLENYGYKSKDLYNFFKNLDYSIWTLDNKKVSLDDFIKHSFKKSSYYHNFLAIP